MIHQWLKRVFIVWLVLTLFLIAAVLHQVATTGGIDSTPTPTLAPSIEQQFFPGFQPMQPTTGWDDPVLKA